MVSFLLLTYFYYFYCVATALDLDPFSLLALCTPLVMSSLDSQVF